ncbi:glycerol kinase [Pontibacillus halophilus JSM 076056 = DSM 19796]|uniref:Glycerol kinase n=1 Tax=Pontibacillus halophilus JSM 076056 = DSM 19796 TaxID=1385510 RepID=A0A0A5GBU2_9BACI|nr:hypothetical protein [Pontibacillus halophilus]KGX88673.1 glycerol kinase [Pontibacillus halophilus JSM 076056 = DSM 19796]
MTTKVKYLSTTALSKDMGIPVKKMFPLLLEKGFIERREDNWVLTKKGENNGGIMKKHPKAGAYIAWSEEIKNLLAQEDTSESKLWSATAISKEFGISKFRINPILSELGLVQKSIKGWVLTKLGESVGGKQFAHHMTGVPFVCWDESLLKNKRFLETINQLQGVGSEEEGTEEVEENTKGFREKFQAKHRTADGHYVRSKAEMLIDNWLYMSEIAHAYERKLPVEEELYCDFYLPVGKVYIEYWGLENDPRYVERKREKLRIYEKYGFRLIELEDRDIQNLDDILPKKLLKFGIQSY